MAHRQRFDRQTDDDERHRRPHPDDDHERERALTDRLAEQGSQPSNDPNARELARYLLAPYGAVREDPRDRPTADYRPGEAITHHRPNDGGQEHGYVIRTERDEHSVVVELERGRVVVDADELEHRHAA